MQATTQRMFKKIVKTKTLTTEQKVNPKLILGVIIGILFALGVLVISVNPDIPPQQLGWFFLFVIIGFAVQIVGTAYSLITVVILLNLGVEPLIASTCVHIVSIFTAGSSSISHYQMGNVNKKLAKGLLVPGIIGAIIGAYALSSFEGDKIKPVIAIYLLVMGFMIIRKTFQQKVKKKKLTGLTGLAAFCGFLDASGGGGWGAILSATLLSRGKSPRFTLGTVNFTKFFITLVAAGALATFARFESFHLVLMGGLILGGIPASYLSAYLSSKLPAKTLMRLVGGVIVVLSISTFVGLWL